MQGKGPCFYNLKKDQGEQNEVASMHPEVVSGWRNKFSRPNAEIARTKRPTGRMNKGTSE